MTKNVISRQEIYSLPALWYTTLHFDGKFATSCLVSSLIIYVKNYENNRPDLNLAIVKIRGNLHDLQIIYMHGCVGFYFLRLYIYITEILSFGTRVMKRCFLGHFRLKLTPCPHRL